MVTDGVDNASIINLENLVKVSQQTGVLIYAVGLLTEEDRKDAKSAHASYRLWLRLRAARLFPQGSHRSGCHRAAGGARHRNQYTIEYSPSDTALDGKFREIKITVNAPGHPTSTRAAAITRRPIKWTKSSNSAAAAVAHKPRHRLRPWRSPYLRWRIETYSGMHAEAIGFRDFWRFTWHSRRELARYLRWASREVR